MLDEQIIDLIIAIYSIISTIIFGTTCIKRKFLSIWFIGCISFSVGAVGFYFRFLNEMFRLLGDIFYLLAIIIFIVATFYEYHYVIRKGEKLQNNSNYLKSLFLVFASFSINFILIVMVVLVFIVLVMLLRIYLKQKSITHISMFLAMIFGLYTIITTFLNNFGIVGTWELSYVGNITLITFLLITALAAPIEDRIQKSEKKYQELYEELEGLINSLPGAFYLFTKEGQYRRWNKELERVSGYSHDEIMMMKPLDFFPSHEKEKVADAIKRGLKEGYEEVEAEVLTKNNQRIPYFFAASYFKTESKDSFVGIGLDITEIKKAEENLRESEEKYHTLFDGANDAIFIMDSGATHLTGFNESHPQLFDKSLEVINIDHHPSNDFYGKYNLVVTEAASTTAVLYEMCTFLNLPIDRQAATCFLTGIYTDTGSFMHSNTDSDTLNIAARLLAKGANLRSISKDIFNTTKISTMRLWGKVMKNTYQTDDGVTMSVITKKDFEDTGADHSEMTGAVDYVNSVPGSEYSVILTERDGKVKGSLRTLRDEVNVADIAGEFGGGGHTKAAGFTLPGSLEKEIRWKVVDK